MPSYKTEKEMLSSIHAKLDFRIIIKKKKENPCSTLFISLLLIGFFFENHWMVGRLFVCLFFCKKKILIIINAE